MLAPRLLVKESCFFAKLKKFQFLLDFDIQKMSFSN